MTDKIEIFECPICLLNIREHRDPYTQSFLAAGVDVDKTPCGKRVIQWRHFGCMQQLQVMDS